jgi:hypothetical protein
MVRRESSEKPLRPSNPVANAADGLITIPQGAQDFATVAGNAVSSFFNKNKKYASMLAPFGSIIKNTVTEEQKSTVLGVLKRGTVFDDQPSQIYGQPILDKNGNPRLDQAGIPMVTVPPLGSAELLEPILRPGAQYIRPYIAASFLVASPTFREQNKDISGTFAEEFFGLNSQFGEQSPLFQKALETSRRPVNPEDDPNDIYARRVGSPMRAGILLIANAISGTQGAEKLDWENSQEVDEFYSQGAPRFFSGVGDFFFNIPDPVNIIPGVAQSARMRYIVRPVNSKNLPTLLREADDAKDPLIRNSFSPLYDEVARLAEDPNNLQPSALLWHPMVGKASGNTSPILIKAHIIGGRELVADTVAAGMDLSGGKFDELAVRSERLASELESLQARERSVTAYVEDIFDPNRYTAPIDSVDSPQQLIIPGTINKTVPTIEEQQWAYTLRDTTLEELRKDIASKSREAQLLYDIQGTGPTMVNQTVPVYALRKLEDKRIAAGRKADESYWGTSQRPDGTYMAYWANPGSRVHETPSGLAQFSGPAGDRSHLEMAARFRSHAKATGKSGEWQKSRYNQYLMESTKASRWNLAEKQVVDMQVDVSAKHIPSVNSLNAEQRALFVRIFEQINIKTTQKRSQVIRRAAEKDYTVVEKFKGIQIPQLKFLIEDIADDYAQSQGRATRTAADEKYVVDELIRGTPGMESQVPGVHFAPRVEDVEDFVINNKKLLNGIVDYIKQGVFDARLIDDIVKNAENYAVNMPGTISKNAGEAFTVGKDTLANAVLAWQNQIWKPLTLLGFVYTTRNVAEGMSRVVVMMASFHEERGFGYADMFTDFTNSGRISRGIKNRRGQTQQKKQDIEFNLKFDSHTKNMSIAQIAAEDTFLTASDSVAMSMNILRDSKNGIENYVAASPSQSAGITAVRRTVGNLFEADRPNDISVPFLDALTSGDYKLAWELSNSMSYQQLSVTYGYIKSQTQEAVNQLAYTASKTSPSPGVEALMPDLINSIGNIGLAADASMLSLLNRAQLRGELEKFIGDKGNFVKQKTGTQKGKIPFRSLPEGKFEPVKGYFFDDSFSNAINEIMLGQISSNASTSSTILNVRSAIAEQAWNKQVREATIFPTIAVDGNKVGLMNPRWAEAFSEHSNNIYYNDDVARLFLEGGTVESVKAWAKTSASAKWRETMYDDASYYPGGVSKGYDRIIEIRSVDIAERYPLVGANGEDLSALRQKVLDRTFTPEDSLKIPELDRMPARGYDVTLHAEDQGKAVKRAYKGFVNKLFNFFGTRPEDTFVRIPFYRMVYRNEVRRRTQFLIDSGKNPERYEQQILNAARSEAYKQVMEKLYSIERYTDFGQVMQFFTPFYMSGQNSSRFWLGAVKDRPQILFQALQLWNVPNKLGVVYNEDGEQTLFDTPWSAERNQIIVGLPKPVADFFGQDYAGIYKSSLDLAFQGQVPGVPSLGGPVIDTIGSNIMRSLSGTKYDPDRFAMEMGLGPNFIQDHVIKFYKDNKENPDENWVFSTVRGAFGYASQWKSLIHLGSIYDDDPTNSAMSKTQSLYNTIVSEEYAKGNYLTADGHGKAITKAFALAARGYIAEFLSGTFGAIAKPKLISKAEMERKKLNGLIKQYGYEEGTLKFAQSFDESQSPIYQAVLASTTSAAENRFGIFANPQSIYNLKLNSEKIALIDENNPDSDVIGYFVNEGNPSKDRSALSDEFLYNNKINGKPLKYKDTNRENIKYDTQKRAFNNEYYPYSAEIDLMQQGDALNGTEQPAYFYEDLKKQFKEELYLKYPNVGIRRQEFEKKDRMLDIRSMVVLINDKKFMNSVGNRSKIVQLADIYINDFRPDYVQQKIDGVSTKEIDASRNQILEDLANKDPEVMKFFQIFFYNDTYEPIDNNNVWGE